LAIIVEAIRLFGGAGGTVGRILLEKTNQIINRLQCIIYELIFEPRHGALMSKCGAIRR